MSDFETVALISIFLVVSAIIVRLIGGDADAALAAEAARRAPEPRSEPQARKVAASAQPVAPAVPPKPIEPAMVKVNLPPPTPIPEQRAASPAPAPVARPAPVAPAAAAAPKPVAADPVAPASQPPRPTAPQAAPVAAPNSAPAVMRPSAAVTIAPPVAPPPAPAPVRFDPPGPVAPAPGSQPGPARASMPIALSKPDVKATLAPGASLSTAAPTPVPSAPKQLSGEDQAILSRYLRPDVKATLYRDPQASVAPQPAPAPRGAEPAAQAALAPASSAASLSAPLAISKPSAAGTVPAGYQAPPSEPKAAPVGPSTGFAPLGVVPDVKATITSSAAPATQPSSDEPSPRALRAASIPPSTAIEPVVQSAAAAGDATLLSTAKRGTRMIGADATGNDVIDLERPAVPRPQTPSIWSNTVPRRAVTEGDVFDPEAAIAPPTVRAERMPVRAETILVRPDASKTIDPSAPAYVSTPRPPPVASLRTEARPLPETGRYANVRFTLPPGALGEE